MPVYEGRNEPERLPPHEQDIPSARNEARGDASVSNRSKRMAAWSLLTSSRKAWRHDLSRVVLSAFAHVLRGHFCPWGACVAMGVTVDVGKVFYSSPWSQPGSCDTKRN